MKRREFIAGLGAATGWSLSARAQQACQTLRYTFQPDCLQSPQHPGMCRPVLYQPDPTDSTRDSKNVDRLDLGPQIAVWLESADRSVFVDTLFVTNQVGARTQHLAEHDERRAHHRQRDTDTCLVGQEDQSLAIPSP